MSPAKRRLLEDRAMRDAARAVVKADVELIKSDVREEGAVSRTMSAGTDYLKLVGEGALDLANEHRAKTGGLIAMAIALLAAWFFRREIGELLGGIVDGLTKGEPDETDDIPEQDDD